MQTRDQSEGMMHLSSLPVVLLVYRDILLSSLLYPGGFLAYVAGGHKSNIFFGNFLVYAIAWCFMQDFRVIREEGSIGTVFHTEIMQ